MDVRDRFDKPKITDVRSRLSIDENFTPTREAIKNDIQPTSLDKVKSLWNNVGEFVRDDLGLEKVGTLLQPKSVIVNGKVQQTANKSFNDLSTEDLNSKLTDLTASKGDRVDGYLYKLRNPSTGEVKYGKAGDGVWNRYGRDFGMQENWEVVYNRPMKNVALAERLIHGNEQSLNDQAYNVGGQKSSLQSGSTEIYNKDPLIIDSMKNIQNMLSPQQKNLADTVWKSIVPKTGESFLEKLSDKFRLKDALNGAMISAGLGDTDEHGNDLTHLSGGARQTLVAQKAKDTLNDFAMGGAIGVDKTLGGIASLLNDKQASDFWKQRAMQNQQSTINKDGVAQTFGEIAPDMLLPAVGKIQKGASLLKRTMQGATTGAIINGGDELLKSMSGIKEGLPQDVAMTTGIGGVIGGFIGTITKNNALGKEIGQAFEHGDDKMKQAILNEYPEAKGALQEYVKNKQSLKQEQTIAPTIENAERQKSEVRPTVKETSVEDKINPFTGELETISNMKTKRGNELDSATVLQGKKALEDIEYNVVEPKDKVGEELRNQTYVPEVNNPKKFKYGYDDRGRVYTEESSLLSPQGGATQKASLKQIEKEDLLPKEEVQRRLEFYDRDEMLRQRYGQTQADYKGGKELSEAQQNANRLQFEKEQYKDILKRNDISKESKQVAREELSRLNKTKIMDYKATKDEIASATDKFESQFKIENKSEKSNAEREQKISEEYNLFKQAKEKNTKEGYEQPKTKSDAEIVRKIVENATEKIKDSKKAISEIKVKERAKGGAFDVSNISEKQRIAYKDDIAKIEDVQNARADLKAYKEGKIGIDELQYREKRRIEDKIDREQKQTLDSVKKANEYKDSIRKQYEDIGIYAKDNDVELKEQVSKTGKKESPEKKQERESKELKQSEAMHNKLVKILEDYRKDGIMPKMKSGERAGTDLLSKSQVEDIKRGILSSKEIADKKSPIGIKENIQDLKEQAKKVASDKTTKAMQEHLGIEWKTKEQFINFKDTVQDASNSVAQITAVLLGSKNLARIVKLAGKDSVKALDGKAIDIRDIVASEMKKILPKDFKIEANKNSVKPIFMTENYGQGEKGLIRNIQKANNVSREEATEFLNAYNKAFDNAAPEMKDLREKIKETFLKGNGEIKYTLPDGFEVKFDLKKKLDGTFAVKGKDFEIKLKTNDVDDMSSAIMPNIIHSVDAYVAREMNKRGISTIHDAYVTPAGKTDEWVQKQYSEVMQKVNESNILDNIMKSMSYKGEALKNEKLSNEAIEQSALAGESIAKEHVTGERELAKTREQEVLSRKTPTDVMKEFMARNNVREGSTKSLPKQMVNEAGYRTMSVARKGDDVFERQLALAHQSPEYNKAMSLKAPKGSNERIWDKAQREIFNEMRARLEQNPLLNGVIQGERKFFTEQGKLVGEETKTFQEILKEEKELGAKLWKVLKQEDLEAVKTIAPNYDRLQTKVKSWSAKKVLTHEESIAKELVHQARQPEGKWENFKDAIERVKTYFKDQVSDTKESRDFDKLFSTKNFKQEEVAKRKEDLKRNLDKRFKGEDKENLNDTLLRTDYNAIQDLKSKAEADKFVKENQGIYDIAKDYIEQGAKAIGENSEQIGYFRNNARAIADELNLPPATVPIIDRLISIEAMTDKAWETLDRIRDTEDFKYVMNVISSNKRRSVELFKNNPEQQVKGFVSEVYNSPKRIEGDKVKYDAERKFETGAIPATLENKKVGTYQKEIPNGDYKNLKEKSEFAKENRLKITQDGSFRRVADIELKDKAGRSKDFNEILAETTRSIDAKEAQQEISKNILHEIQDESSMFSTEEKAGYRKITPEETGRMPKVVGDALLGKWINKRYEKRLLGRDEVRLYSGENQVGKILDRLVKNSVMNFKQNVILKNPKSYVNATAVNQLMAMSAGVNPKKLVAYQIEAIQEIKKTNKLREELAILKAEGKDTEHIQKELDKSLLYQMEQKGLAINKLEVAGDDKSLLGQMLSDVTGGEKNVLAKAKNKVTHELYLSQDSTIGKGAFKTFGYIDAQGRYMMAKHFMDNGMSLEKAVKQANGLFGDMGQMSPAVIEILDKYGVVPFMKWFSTTTPMMMKLVKDNPVKAIGLGAMMYAMQIETNKDYSTVNPIEGIVNFGDSAIALEYMKQSQKDGFGDATKSKIATYFTPKVYSETAKEIAKPEKHGMFIKEQMEKPKHGGVDYRPLTQRIIKD